MHSYVHNVHLQMHICVHIYEYVYRCIRNAYSWIHPGQLEHLCFGYRCSFMWYLTCSLILLTHLHTCASDLHTCASEYVLHWPTYAVACCTFSSILVHSCICTPVSLNMCALVHQLMQLHADMCPGPLVHLYPTPTAHSRISHLTSSTLTHLPSHVSIDWCCSACMSNTANASTHYSVQPI